ncbi:36520_t:CDS:2 [Racocetra persica]|uniref:36520_t:CDS:1 n=1 Tax=Racocetra persica TaxID=160502 RepID=A0ACA9L3Y0_9GLOM|nr:36520_t:CDS:2 [Racocetra persica]
MHTVTYASVLNIGNSNCEFDTTDIPLCIPHCMFSVVVICTPKQLQEFIHFGIECTKYNSVTGLFKFSTSGKMMVEATNIDYLRTSNVTHNTYENFSSNFSTQSIIDIIADDIESITTNALKTVDSTITLANHNITVTPGPSKNLVNIPIPYVQIESLYERKKQKKLLDYTDLDTQEEEQLSYKDDEKTKELDKDKISQNKSEEESQPKKRKRNIRITTKEKKEKRKIN